MRSLSDLQRAPETSPHERLPELPIKVERIRTFDTPEFAGMQFLEVETKTALNRVRGMSFSWSINPYRGCSHACAYCLVGETPVLLADGRTKPIAEIRPGDQVYGTQRHGDHRRYAVTSVLDHWSTLKPAYRIRLEDGTQLIASGDHRFLSNRGWVHVSRAERARPHLKPDSKLLAVDRAISGRRRIEGTALRSGAALGVVSIEELGIRLPMYDITTGTGDFIANSVVSHNCFARPSHAYLNLSPLAEFERKIVVKSNLVEVLRRELARPSWRGEHVAMGTNTDPYQRCEGRYRLMPGIITALGEYRTPFSILTKGTLITRDLDHLLAAAERVPVSAALTIGLLDEALWRELEPGTPPPRARLEAVRVLNQAGIPTGVMLAPVMPGLNDDREQLAELVERAAAAGATDITPIVLHLRRGRPGSSGPPAWMSVREVFWPWLTEHHPELVDRYERLYRGSQAPKPYREEISGFVAERRAAAWRRNGRPPSTRRGASSGPPAPAGGRFPEQLSLMQPASASPKVTVQSGTPRGPRAAESTAGRDADASYREKVIEDLWRGGGMARAQQRKPFP